MGVSGLGEIGGEASIRPDRALLANSWHGKRRALSVKGLHMKVLLVGASGRLGTAVHKALDAVGHEVLAASRDGELTVDITDSASIGALYDKVGSVDAVVCAAGSAPLGSIETLERADFVRGVGDKLLGQVDLVLQGISHMSDAGSFTLVSGIVAYEPIRNGSVLATVNGGLDAFVRGASTELPRGIRLNTVSATMFEEAAEAYGPYFPGFVPVSTSVVAQAFVKSIDGVQTGRVFKVGF
jgi:NAD(P)-dependent dehydrogenase (short-subunit alcohol dehydrogenase family)